MSVILHAEKPYLKFFFLASHTTHVDGVAAVGDHASASISVSGSHITFSPQISVHSQGKHHTSSFSDDPRNAQLL